MNRHFICLCIQKESWDTLDCNFRRPSWPPSWKICNWCYWFLHNHTLRPSLYMNRHFICLGIRKESWDTFDSEFRRPCWPPSWKKKFSQFHIPDHIWDTPVKFGWNIPNGSEVITISFWGSKKTPKWPSCDFFRIWPTRVKDIIRVEIVEIHKTVLML